MESTLPRALMAVLAGAAFGVAGCAFQVMLRNPLASPDVLASPSGPARAPSSPSSSSVARHPGHGGGPRRRVLAAALISARPEGAEGDRPDGRRRGRAGRRALGGRALGARAASIYQAQDALIWLSGSLNTVTWTDILRMLALDALLVPLLFVLAARLPVLGLGDDLAAGLGVRVGRCGSGSPSSW